MKRILSLLLALLVLFGLCACSAAMPAGYWEEPEQPLASFHLFEDETRCSSAAAQPTEQGSTASDTPDEPGLTVSEDGRYDAKEEVALYLHLFGHLPSNYITKKQAEKLGWSGGSLEPYAPGCCIGGGYFGNYEGILPEAPGRSYTECDIDTMGQKSRGAKRIVFSNDGLIFYTGDHYESFELLYGEVEGW